MPWQNILVQSFRSEIVKNGNFNKIQLSNEVDDHEKNILIHSLCSSPWAEHSYPAITHVHQISVPQFCKVRELHMRNYCRQLCWRNCHHMMSKYVVLTSWSSYDDPHILNVDIDMVNLANKNLFYLKFVPVQWDLRDLIVHVSESDISSSSHPSWICGFETYKNTHDAWLF